MENSESQSTLEKAKEKERLKQECESLRNEAYKLRQKEAAGHDKIKSFEGLLLKVIPQFTFHTKR
jgi:hypothetical protein